MFFFWAGTAYGSLEFPKLTFTEGVNMRAGINKIALLSIAVGLPVYLSLSLALLYLLCSIYNIHDSFDFNYSCCCLCFWAQNVGPHFETWNAGVLGPVTLNGLNEGRRDLSWQKWTYKVCLQSLKYCFLVSLTFWILIEVCLLNQVGLEGEKLNLHSLSGGSSVEWAEGSLVAQRQPLTWYRVSSLKSQPNQFSYFYEIQSHWIWIPLLITWGFLEACMIIMTAVF